MKKQSDKTPDESDELREHYDFDYSKARPNRFAERLNEDTVMVTLDPDIAAAFPTAEAVNDALRLVMQLSKIPTTTT